MTKVGSYTAYRCFVAGPRKYVYGDIPFRLMNKGQQNVTEFSQMKTLEL